MVNFFSKKKSQYNGFAKYNEEYSRHQAAAPAQRAQSLSSASQAAMAALQMHSKPAPKPATGAYQRANSMQSYTYTPKASYVAGPAAPRTYSLRSPDRRNTRQPPRHNSLSSRNNSLSSRNNSRNNSLSGVRRLPEFAEEDEFAGFDSEDDNVVVTTKTTKVVDASGRTKSITTETIRTMPDGSNIIETKTTNVSRPTSRSNSLKTANVGSHLQNPNLRKIEEDLTDFDSTYLDETADKAHQSPILKSPVEAEFPAEESERRENRRALESPPKIRASERSNSLASTQSGKRLRSILKNNAAAFREDPASHESSPKEPISPVVRNLRPSSMASGANSIKFHDKVETISYDKGYEQLDHRELQKDEWLKKEQMKQDNLHLYDKAMQVAREKVYGPEVPDEGDEEFSRKKSEKKLKTDEKRLKTEAAGVRPNYIYENHHKQFQTHSLRSADVLGTSRKERLKEEKKKLKEEEKKREQLVKEEEKRREQLLKEAEKERKAEEKRKKKSPFSLFKKRKASDATSESRSTVLDESQIPELEPKVSESADDEFVDVPENLDDPADKRMSSIPVVAEKTLGEPFTLDPREPKNEGLKPLLENHVEKPVLDEPSSPLLPVSEPTKTSSSLPVSEPTKSPATTPAQSSPVLPASNLTDIIEPVSQFPTLVSGENGKPEVLDSKYESPSSNEADVSKAEYVDAPLDNEVFIVNGGSPREALVLDRDSGEGFEESHLVLPENTLEDGIDEPELPDTTLSTMEGWSSSGKKLKIKSDREQAKEKKEKSPKKGSKFKRTIEKYFLTTYK